MELVELDRNEFIEYSKNYPYSLFFQSPFWMDIKEKNGWDGKIIGLKDNKKIVAAGIFLIKRLNFINKNMYYCPRGFLIDYNNLDLLTEFVEKIKMYLKKNNALFLKINPYVKYQKRDVNGKIIDCTKNDILIKKLRSLGFVHNGFYINMDEKKDLEPRWLSVLDIENENLESLFKNMRATTRWCIRNSEKNALKIIECNKEDLKEFKALMQHTANRRDFIDRPLSYYENIYDVLSDKKLVKVLLVQINFKELLEKTELEYNNLNTKIEKIKNNSKKSSELKELLSQIQSFQKRVNELKNYILKYGHIKTIAGGLYMLYGRQLVYLFGASYKEFMKYNSQYLLQWEMIKYAKQNNYQTFNFYGIDGNFSKDSKNYGLFDFKRGFNSEVVELIGEFDLIMDKPRYIIYNFLFKNYKMLKKIKNHIRH